MLVYQRVWCSLDHELLVYNGKSTICIGKMNYQKKMSGRWFWNIKLFFFPWVSNHPHWRTNVYFSGLGAWNHQTRLVLCETPLEMIVLWEEELYHTYTLYSVTVYLYTHCNLSFSYCGLRHEQTRIILKSKLKAGWIHGVSWSVSPRRRHHDPWLGMS